VAIGKLYYIDGDLFIGEVNYEMRNLTPTNWWGELSFIDYHKVSDGSGYIIEMEDKRQGRCSLKKRVNRAVTGVPPRYVFHFSGTGPLVVRST